MANHGPQMFSETPKHNGEGLPPLTQEQLAAIIAANTPSPQQQAQRQFEDALASVDAKTVMKQHEAAMLSARQRAQRPDPVLAIATEGDQISVHVDGWKVVKYVGGGILIAAAGYGLLLLVREGAMWVAKKYIA